MLVIENCNSLSDLRQKLIDGEEVRTARDEPCDDVISRDMALEKMADYVASGYADSAEDFEEYSRIICQLPLVNPTKTGHWIEHEIKDTCRWLICSVCGYEWVNKKENFCPNCGAKMVEPQERSDRE